MTRSHNKINEVGSKINEFGGMYNIYGNATLVICAAAASGSKEGFLHNFDPIVTFDDSMDIRLPVTLSNGVKGRITYFQFPDKLRNGWRLEPADSRGWILQEVLLAPRSIIFGSSTLRWRCLTETDVSGDSGLLKCRWNEIASGMVEPLMAWIQMVEVYTVRHFGKKRDILNACSGIAIKYREACKKVGRDPGYYLAGLWQHDFNSLALWAIVNKKPVTKKPKKKSDEDDEDSTFRASSWSWASTDGGVEYRQPFSNGHGRGLAKILRVPDAVSNQTFDKPVAQAALTIEGHLVPGSDLPIWPHNKSTCRYYMDTAEANGYKFDWLFLKSSAGIIVKKTRVGYHRIGVFFLSKDHRQISTRSKIVLL